MKTIVAITLASSLFLVPECFAQVTSQSKADEVRIGAWNIEWLGFPDKRARPGKDNPQRPEDLAEYIHSTGVDVLALEEIGVDSDKAPWTSRELERLQRALKDQYQEVWQYVIFPKTVYPEDTEDFVKRGQHLAIAWKSEKATQVGGVFDIPVGSDETYGIKFFERRANAVKLSFGEGKTDVVFIPIHLKSNRNEDNPADKTFTQRQRAAELKAFIAQLPTLKEHFKDEDIVLLGDTNILGDEKTANVLADAAFLDLNRDEQGTTAVWGDGSNGYRTAPFDRIFIPQSQSEFAACRFQVHRTSNGTDDEIKLFRRKLSDHYLISSVIKIQSDDD
ncbi:MAG: hypothetical protein FJ308_07210 [Planctomycetes bacterium]|nr:hypothetical protein [Planctomycetota bacterium]